MAELVFSDSGIPFDPTSRPSPDITLKPDDRLIGGLGIHIIKQRMDDRRSGNSYYKAADGRSGLPVRGRKERAHYSQVFTFCSVSVSCLCLTAF